MFRKFVTAFNGARDYYELPLALAELGLLRGHISDIYTPDWCAPFLSVLPGKLATRRRAGLSSRYVHCDLGAAFSQFICKLPTGSDPYYNVDRAISLTAAEFAKRTDSDLFLHNQYAYWAFRELRDRQRYMYQFHPHAASVRDLLQHDFEQYPEVRWSFENEQDSLPIDRQRWEGLQEWEMADAIVCASSFTRASLIKQGCDPNIVHVVPYGISPKKIGANRPREKYCRFLFVGQGVQRKGLHHLLRAWKRAKIDKAELIVVARRLDPGIEPFLDDPSVQYLPGVSNDELESLYNSSDVFVMPSIVEGFGLVYLEALARGLHCIGTYNTGLPDLNVGNEAVSYVTPGSIDELASVLVNRAADVMRGTLVKSEVAAAVADQTWDLRRNELRDVIRTIIG